MSILRQWGAQNACKYERHKEVKIRLKSGKQWIVLSPIFCRAKPKGKRGRPAKRQKGTIRHLGLEILGIIRKVSPCLVEICVSMAVLCPSFEVAANALRGQGITMNEHLLQNIIERFSNLAKSVRVECQEDDAWKKPKLKILICIDGGRIRGRKIKPGPLKQGQKRKGYKTEWFEPRLFTISQFDKTGKKIKTINPIIDGTCGDSIADIFELLKHHLMSINIEEASEIVFCADGGIGIWPRTEKLIDELELKNVKQIIDYTHAKQNMANVTKLIKDALKLSDIEGKKLSKQIRDLLWNGNIKEIENIVGEKLAGKRKKTSREAALKKLSEYFGNHLRFQYKKFQKNFLPTGSGTVESAIRRIINLRIKGTGLFWYRENAENIVFLRSVVLTGRLRQAIQKGMGIVKSMFNNNTLDHIPTGV